MSKIDSTLAQSLRNAARKFASPTEFGEAVLDIVTKAPTKAELEIIKQFELVGAYFTKLAGKPVDATPAMIDSEFSVNIGAMNIHVLIKDVTAILIVARHDDGHIDEFKYEGAKASHIIKKWEQHMARVHKGALARHKKELKEIGKLLPKQSKSQFKAKKAKTLAAAEAAEQLEEAVA